MRKSLPWRQRPPACLTAPQSRPPDDGPDRPPAPANDRIDPQRSDIRSLHCGPRRSRFRSIPCEKPRGHLRSVQANGHRESQLLAPSTVAPLPPAAKPPAPARPAMNSRRRRQMLIWPSCAYEAKNSTAKPVSPLPVPASPPGCPASRWSPAGALVGSISVRGGPRARSDGSGTVRSQSQTDPSSGGLPGWSHAGAFCH